MYFIFPQELKIVFQIISDNNGSSRLIGGCVRDYLINKTPSDFDIATTLEPKAIIHSFQRVGVKTIPTGIKYGTVSVKFQKYNFEITTLRKDIKCLGRDAEVEFTNDWQEDAARRDFTINAMSITSNYRLYDYFQGQEDLAHRRVKFIGNPTIRIKEDYLRILRYLRFLGYFGLTNLDKHSYQTSIQYAANIKFVSKDRIKQEVMKLLGSQYVKEVLIQINQDNIFQHIGLSPIIIDNKNLKKLNFKLGDAIINLAILVLSSHKVYDKNRILKDNLQLSKKEFRELTLFSSFHEQVFNDFYHYKFWYEFGAEAYLRFLFVIKNVNKVPKYNQYIKNVKSKKFYFPINGIDLQKLKIKNQCIGTILKNARIYWHQHGNRLNKEEMIAYIIKIMKKKGEYGHCI